MRKFAGTLVLTLALFGAVAAAPATETPFHFQLNKSAPEADSRIESPEEVRLWFSQAPQDNSMQIRLIDADGELVETGEVTRDAEDATVYSIAMNGSLPAAGYTVSWRAIGQDGHVVRGDFAFSVTAQN